MHDLPPSTRRRLSPIGLAVAAATGWIVAPAIPASALPPAGVGPSYASDPTALSVPASNARKPDVSGDGRWVVYEADLDGRATVYRTDRESDSTTELSLLPEGIRDGDTISPVISRDGCVVVATTQIPFDLFRDDDTAERWDVYRLVVPECGGQANAWELVSADERTGTARDDVVPEFESTVSGSGVVVAYTHPLDGAAEGVTTVTVVDLTLPIGDADRNQIVAGMPVEMPNTVFKYRGAAEPALSANGRHLAFRSDTTASEPLPGWGTGAVPGGWATPQIYVWDRGATDRVGAVHLVSGRNSMPSLAGGWDPAISEDGRIIAFRSSDQGLVDAVYPNCNGVCPSQIYRYDRDTDANGVFDQPPQSSPMSIVSAADAGRVLVGLPIAGNQSSWAPTLNVDGSQVGFLTDATNLLVSRRPGGGTVDDGDLIIAEALVGQLRRVVGEFASSVPAAHGHPVLSDTGRVVVFDTLAGADVTGSGVANGERDIVAATSTPKLSLAALDFGTVVTGLESTELYVTVLNAGPGAFEPETVTSSSPNFAVTGGTCNRGVLVPAGGDCSIRLTFSPTLPAEFIGELVVSEDGLAPISVSARLRGVGGDPTLQANPAGIDLAPGLVGQTGGSRTFDIENTGFIPTSIASIRIAGAHADDFAVINETCTNRALNAKAICSIDVEFRPTESGYRSALVVVSTPLGQYTAAVVSGAGRYAPKFDSTIGTVRPGDVIGLGGSGFPANSAVVITFDDGSRPFAIVETNESGVFLTQVPVPVRERPGRRQLLAIGPQDVVAAIEVEVVRPARSTQAVSGAPGYGLGF